MHSRRQVPIKSFDTSPSFVRLIVIASVINVRGDRRRRFHIIYCRYNNIVPAIYYTSCICMQHATSLARAPQMSASRSFYYCPDRGHALTCNRCNNIIFPTPLRLNFIQQRRRYDSAR